MDHFDPTSITHEAGNNWALKATNLRKLVRNLQDYYHEVLRKDADFESILSNINETVKDSDPEGLLAIVELVAVAAISCEDREVFVNRMREISEENLGEFQMFLKGGMEAISSFDDDDNAGEDDDDADSVVFDGDENHNVPSSPGGALFPSHGDISADGNSELLKEREELRKELSDARRELAQIKSQVKLNEEDNKKEKDKLRALNEDIQERLTKREEELHVVEQDLSKQKRSLEEVHNEVNDLKEKSASLADELDVEKGKVLQLRKTEAMVEAYRKKVETLESANQQMGGLENQTQNYADQIMKLERENASIPALEKTLEESQTLAKKLEARNNEAEDALRAKNAEISKLKNDLATSDKSKKMYEDELNELRAKQEGAEAAALALSPQADNDKMKRMEIENSNLKAKVEQLESGTSEGGKVAELEKELADMNAEVSKLQSDKEKLEAYTKKTLQKFQEKYLVALQDCKAKLKEKHDKIEALEMRSANEKMAQKREERLLSSAIYELGLGIMQNNLKH
jgi:protein HOOK3